MENKAAVAKDPIRHINIWMPNNEFNDLKHLVEVTGMTQQNLIRKLIKEACALVKG